MLDCRNKYETGVGRFVGAEPLNTENFRESFDVLSERLKDVDKSKPIMTYCTGGIRCVKVGAYLTQELNFTNVNRLAGGSGSKGGEKKGRRDGVRVRVRVRVAVQGDKLRL